MSELLEKFSGIKHLPIFPLPLVMVPGELVPLHIFEERYRKMLRDVEAGDRPGADHAGEDAEHRR
jgi:Lon protease-like protein